MTAKLAADRMRRGPWTSCLTSWRRAASCKLQALTIVDTFSRFSLALEPRFTFRGANVVDVLEKVGREVGFPATIRVEQGTEFVSRDLDPWAYQRGVTLDFSRPRKANGQCLYRGVQRALLRRMPEYALGREPCGCAGKDEALGQIQQRGTPPWGNWAKAPDNAAELR